jgi:6-phosphogluconolactonase (cycloisomerase 2 family)
MVRVVSGSSYAFDSPSALTSDGTHLWVANFYGMTQHGGTLASSVTELNLSDGSLVRVLSASSYAFDAPWSLASDGAHLWVANYNGNSLTELNLSNGSLVRVLSDSSYCFNGPSALTSVGAHLWVANSGYGASSVTELNLNS